MNHLRIILCCLLPLTAIAQQREDLSGSMPFFLKKAERYQRWLDTTGLGTALRVEKVRYKVDKNTHETDFTELEFFLLLKTNDLDSAASLWNRLQLDYERNGGRSLQEALFRTYAHNMEIPAEQGNIQIQINDPDGTRNKCFFIWIWDEKGYIKDSVQVNACRSQKFILDVPAIEVTKVLRKGRTETIYQKDEANVVFNKVLNFANARYPFNKYAGTDCSGRHPSVEEESRIADELVFTVSELCREALSNGSLGIWCLLARKTGWEKDCNDIRRERITFTVKYLENQNGYQLQCRIDGKFGSAAYVPRSSDYFDMDPDFLRFEQDFADQFKKDLVKFLAKP
ncbi:MAG: hypothetical protein WCR52_03655 [Bacteroidota bacterium]